MRPSTDEELGRINNVANDEITDSVIPARNSLKNTPVEKFQHLVFTLTSKERSRCAYQIAGTPAAQTAEVYETRLFTRDGRDLLRVAIQSSSEPLWIYHSLSSYAATGVVIEPGAGYRIYGGYNSGNLEYTVGYAADATIH